MRFAVWLVLIAAVLGMAVWGCCGLTRHAIVALDKWGDAAPNPKQEAQILELSTGALKNANVAVQNMADATGDWSDSSKAELRDLRTTLTEANRFISDMRGVARSADGEVASLQQTTDAATALLKTSDQAIDQLNDDRHGISPVMASYLETGNDLDELLKRRAVGEMLDNVARLTGSASRMADTADQVETKFTYSYLHPSKNKWVRVGNAIKPYAPLGIKSLACWAVPGSCF